MEAALQTLFAKMERMEEKIDRLSAIAEKRVITDRRKSMTISEAQKELGKSNSGIRKDIRLGKLEIVEGSSPQRVTVRSINQLL